VLSLRPGYQEECFAACVEHFKGPKGREPAFIDVSVGGGKTAIAAFLIQNSASKGARVMLLARQAELVEQDAEFAERVGVDVSIYSASLGKKQMLHRTIMGTEGTVARAIGAEFQKWAPDFVVIDECHMVDFEETESMFMRILLHFIAINPRVRILGLTGSPFRGTESIIGKFWKHCLYRVETELLIDQGWLVGPVFGWPEHEEDTFDMSELQPRYGSWEFSEQQMDDIRAKDPDRTMRITLEVVHRTENDLGVLIFAQTKKHCKEIAQWLPPGSWAIITDDTPAKERAESLRKSRSGEIKYMINVGVLTTGVDVPYWQTVVYMRPVGSLVLLIQSMGRVLRLLLDGEPDINSMTAEQRKELIAASRKPFSRVLDYCGVFERLGPLYDNPLLAAAELERSRRDGSVIFCPKCNAENSDKARRCVGVGYDGVRCDHFWVFNACPQCGTRNDITARQCRSCDHTLIDPNRALLGKAYSDDDMVPVKSMEVQPTKNGAIMVTYVLDVDDPPPDGNPYEIFAPAGSEVARRVWYNKFLVPQCPASWRSKVYSIKNAQAIMKMKAAFDAPIAIGYRINDKGKFVIGRKRFRSGRLTDGSGKNVDN